ncbi:DUF3278 domain-containing protein [Lactobacillaceae bacterium Melli_B4]
MKNNKRNWYLTLISYFYGVRGELDEYKVQEINRIGNNAFLFILIAWPLLILLTSFLPYLVGVHTALLILMVSSILILIGVSIYTASSVNKLHLADIDSYDEKDYQIWIKKSKHRAIILSVIFFLVERIFYTLFNAVSGGSFINSMLSVKDNLSCLIFSILMGIFSYYSMKQKIKKP